jgi:glycosyltransferase involved in cell wall biosynthesis
MDVAVYASSAGPLYARQVAPVGGAERQSGHVARALTRHGFRVCHVVFGEELYRERDDVEVIEIPAAWARRGIARRRAVLEALRAADAQVYIQRSAGFETGFVGAYARSRRRRFVFSSSSDIDFVRDRALARIADVSLDEWPTRLQYLFGLRLADEVVTQTFAQRAVARRERGIESRVIRSFCEPAALSRQRRDAFLWIGRFIPLKDHMAYVDLAERVPEAHFLMLAPPPRTESAPVAAELVRRAEAVPNLELLEPVSGAQLDALYARAVAVVNTSWFEGFPNTFLEAWARGTPVLSLRVDPDGVIARHDLGISCNGSTERLVDAARDLWQRREPWEQTREYVRRVHHPDVVGPEWARLVDELVPR